MDQSIFHGRLVSALPRALIVLNVSICSRAKQNHSQPQTTQPAVTQQADTRPALVISQRRYGPRRNHEKFNLKMKKN
jgi:hypothetical protein